MVVEQNRKSPPRTHPRLQYTYRRVHIRTLLKHTPDTLLPRPRLTRGTLKFKRRNGSKGRGSHPSPASPPLGNEPLGLNGGSRGGGEKALLTGWRVTSTEKKSTRPPLQPCIFPSRGTEPKSRNHSSPHLPPRPTPRRGGERQGERERERYPLPYPVGALGVLLTTNFHGSSRQRSK